MNRNYKIVIGTGSVLLLLFLALIAINGCRISTTKLVVNAPQGQSTDGCAIKNLDLNKAGDRDITCTIVDPSVVKAKADAEVAKQKLAADAEAKEQADHRSWLCRVAGAFCDYDSNPCQPCLQSSAPHNGSGGRRNPPPAPIERRPAPAAQNENKNENVNINATSVKVEVPAAQAPAPAPAMPNQAPPPQEVAAPVDQQPTQPMMANPVNYVSGGICQPYNGPTPGCAEPGATYVPELYISFYEQQGYTQQGGQWYRPRVDHQREPRQPQRPPTQKPNPPVNPPKQPKQPVSCTGCITKPGGGNGSGSGTGTRGGDPTGHSTLASNAHSSFAGSSAVSNRNFSGASRSTFAGRSGRR